GAPTLLKQIASISVPDARLIVIQPWDLTAIAEIEKTILKSNLGITPMNDGKVVRLSVPQLSKERREELAKVVKNMAEEGRISLRTIRREANESVKKLEDDKVIAEDERFKGQDEIQKLTDKYIQSIEQILKDKEKELTQF
ncbi:MAG: ribosome recycling factor, partial [Candidatus Omnitrophica bacterium]|nr:ribosome recycling factor [Candidatus Omnitrophota bacterium]